MALAKTRLHQPAPLKDTAGFDLESYRARMASHLDQGAPNNTIFFDALQFAYELHQGQVRKSRAPYISHPCAVAEILARELLVQDPLLLAAALLHDVVEDIDRISVADIEYRFGTTVAELVDGCTKLTRSQKDRVSLKDLTHSKIFLTASRQLGVLVIKLADRLHNLRTLHYLPKSKRQRIAQETIEVYAPLAAKLNIFPLKRELYHLALTYLYPKKSKKVLNSINALAAHPDVLALEAAIRDCLARSSLDAAVRCRIKGLGIYYNPIKKTLRIGNAESRVDLIVVVAAEDLLDCYRAMGVVNTQFAVIARSIRDFIANPKNNGYMSLHTRIHYRGEGFLIKIRTPRMDYWATYGLLSEWGRDAQITAAHLHEVSGFLRSLGEYGGAGPQRKDLLRLSESEEIAVYTPKGELQTFPRGSVVLDFAYKIHSDLGNHCEGALINGEWAPPSWVLKDGDAVEIVMSAEAQELDPDLEFLCKTPKARASINKALQRRRLHYACDVGRQILIQEMRRHGLGAALLDGDRALLVLEVLNLKKMKDLYARIGQDLLSPHVFLYYFQSASLGRKQEQESHPIELGPPERNTLELRDLDWAVHKFAQCCKPFPGQEQVVAILSERGVTFHQADCHDLYERHDLPEQSLLDVAWASRHIWEQPIRFEIQATSRKHRQLMQVLARVPEAIDLERVEIATAARNRKTLRIVVVLRDFAEAQGLFNQFPRGSLTIERYSRVFSGRGSSTFGAR